MGHKRPTQGQRGIWKHKANDDDADVKVVDTSYQSDKLAEIVTLAWLDQNNYKQKLLDHSTNFAKQELESRGIKLKSPVVLTEDEYDDGWQMDSGDDVVLVLPDATRAKITGADTSQTLLETAKLLMACVPNGI